MSTTFIITFALAGIVFLIFDEVTRDRSVEVFDHEAHKHRVQDDEFMSTL